MHILYTGADGYIGAVLGPKLLQRGHDAVGIDTGLYRRGWLFDDGQTRPMVISKDTRQLSVRDLRGFDAVIHLAELSNDPLGENNPEITMEVNYRASIELARRCKLAGVKRFIYTSSCGIYDTAGSDLKSETSTLDPQTAYARCKVLVERDVRGMVDPNFTPVLLRNATAFGASPRQRFDLILNNLAGCAFTAGKICVLSDGASYRPLVHVEDICQAILCALDAPREAVCGEAFNVGDDTQNYTVRGIAEIVSRTFRDAEIVFGRSDRRDRGYPVSFAKIKMHLPTFKCRWNAERGAAQLKSVFERIRLDEATFNAPPFTRLSELRHLRMTEQLDSRLRWTPIREFVPGVAEA